MSRITAIGFFTFDAIVSIATIAHSSLTLAVILLTMIGSFSVAVLSKTVRSLLWPSYFWDEAGS